MNDLREKIKKIIFNELIAESNFRNGVTKTIDQNRGVDAILKAVDRALPKKKKYIADPEIDSLVGYTNGFNDCLSIIHQLLRG